MEQHMQGEPSHMGELPAQEQEQQPMDQLYDHLWAQLQADLNERFAHVNNQNAAQQQLLQTLGAQLAAMNNNNTPVTMTGQATPNLQPGNQPGPQPGPQPGQQPGPQPEPSRPRPKLPDVSLFEGKEGQFRTWLNQIRQKLTTDALCYPTDDDKFNYIYSRLGGKAANMIAAYVERRERNGYTYQSFLEHLMACFDDPHRQTNALNKIRKVTQGNALYSTHLREYENLLAESNAWDWDDAAKISMFKGTLNDSLKETVASNALTLNENNWALWTRSVGKLATEREFLRRQTAPKPTTAAATPRAEGDAMEWEPTSATYINRGVIKPKGGYAKGPNGKILRAKWVSEEEIENRKKKRLCFRCGGSNHIARACKFAPAINPNPDPVRINVANTAPMVEEVSGDEDEELPKA